MAQTSPSTEDAPQFEFAANCERNGILRDKLARRMVCQTPQPDHFAPCHSLKLTRDGNGVPVVEFSSGGSFTFTAQGPTALVDAFYRIALDRENKIVILSGAEQAWRSSLRSISLKERLSAGSWVRTVDGRSIGRLVREISASQE